MIETEGVEAERESERKTDRRRGKRERKVKESEVKGGRNVIERERESG